MLSYEYVKNIKINKTLKWQIRKKYLKSIMHSENRIDTLYRWSAPTILYVLDQPNQVTYFQNNISFNCLTLFASLVKVTHEWVKVTQDWVKVTQERIKVTQECKVRAFMLGNNKFGPIFFVYWFLFQNHLYETLQSCALLKYDINTIQLVFMYLIFISSSKIEEMASCVEE